MRCFFAPLSSWAQADDVTGDLALLGPCLLPYRPTHRPAAMTFHPGAAHSFPSDMVPDRSSFVNAERVLAELFQDPYEPKGCAAMFHSCIETLRECSMGMLITDFAVSLNILARFAFAPRNASSYPALGKALRCICNKDKWDKSDIRHHLHIVAESLRQRDPAMPHSDPTCAIYMVASGIVSLIHATMKRNDIVPGRLYRVARRAHMAETNGENARWPRQHADLLPYGTRESIRGLTQWLNFNIDIFPMVARLLQYILGASRATVASDISSPELVSSTVQYFSHMKQMWEMMDQWRNTLSIAPLRISKYWAHSWRLSSSRSIAASLPSLPYAGATHSRRL